MPPLRLLLALLAAPAFVAAALAVGPDPVGAPADPLLHRGGGYTGSAVCATCHPDHHASWRRTHHATMTQRPAPDTVLGAFDGREVAYAGQTARPFRSGDCFCIEVPDGRGGRRTAEVALLVGSRRYQQYFEAEPRGESTAYVRLPILWHQEQQRWLHLNTVFLGPDDPNWQANAATWNENCIFCHNTGPEPRLRDDAARRTPVGHFDSQVAELGIACESCHGPGGGHADALRDPLVRYLAPAAASGRVVDPARLDQERAVSVCGQCHGARLPEPLARLRDWFATGPSYRPGERLRDHAAPIQRDTPVPGDRSGRSEQFALRFWNDGTPRLTAYELQGVQASRCYTHGPMTCQSCHAMHDGDPKGQLRPDRLGDAACAQCHAEVAADVAAHTHHPVGSSGSRCVECHMPKVVFGVLEVHRSHRIENPDPARDAAAGRPHACTLCHTDRTLPWAAAAMRQWWGERYRDPVRRADGAPLELADAIASLHAGDAAVRAVYAAALGRAEAAPAAVATAAQRAHLAVAMGDGWPSVRWFAQRSLQALEQRAPAGLGELLAGIDHTAAAGPRRTAVFAALDRLAGASPAALLPPPPGLLVGPDRRLDLPAVVRLTDLQGRNPISIGE